MNPDNLQGDVGRVSGVSLNKNSTALHVGGSEQLHASVIPSTADNSAVSWVSSNIFVADVDENGLVTAIGEGVAIITVITEDGGFTAECEITVLPVPVAVTGIILNDPGAIEAGSDMQLTFEIIPLNATNQNVTWNSTNASVATVGPGGLLSGITPGTSMITVTTDDGGFSDNITVTVVDTTPPENGSWTPGGVIIEGATISTTFNEPMNKASVENVAHYSISAAEVTITQVSYNTGSRVATFTIEYTVTTGTVNYTITPSGPITDVAGNNLNPTASPSYTMLVYAVSFDSDGGSPVSSKTVLYPETIIDALPDPPTKIGWTFAGWFTALNGGGTEFTAATAVTGDITVYANWNSLPTYVVTYDNDGVNHAQHDVIFPDTTVGALPADPVKSGYIFGGWWTGINGTGTQFLSDTTVANNMTVYAFWESYSYTVFFDSDGGSPVANKTVASPATTVDSLVASVKANHAFEGWFTGIGGGGDEFTTGTVVTGDITLYANWASCPAGPPTGLAASAGSYADKVGLTWTAAADATGYKIYRSESEPGTYVNIGTSATNAYDDTGAVPEITYYYRVSATRLGCDETGMSAFTSGFRAASPWEYIIGSSSADRAGSVVTDDSGNVYIAGYYWNTVDFGGGNRTSKGNDDVFVVKLNTHGVYQWDYTAGGTLSDNGTDLHLDGDGNVYVIGEYQNTVNFGGGNRTSKGSADIFIIKLNSGGLYQWDYVFGGTNQDLAKRIAVDSAGNVYAAGSFQVNVDFGGGLRTNMGLTDGFLVKVDTNGAYMWDKTWGSTVEEYAHGVTVDVSDFVYVSGEYSETIDFGGGNRTSNGYSDIFVVKLDGAGTHQWDYTVGGDSFDRANDIAVDADSKVYFTGLFRNTVDFGGGGRTAGSYSGIFLVKLDSGGNYQWDYTAGGNSTNYCEGNGIAVDNSGYVYTTGYYEKTVDFGGGNKTNAGLKDIFAVKHNINTGTYVNVYTAGGTGNDVGHGIAVDSKGNVYVAGEFNSTVNFGFGNRTSAGLTDAFLRKFITFP